jgi:hypothetical protein
VSGLTSLRATLRNGDLITGTGGFSLSEDTYLAPYALLTNIVVDPVAAPSPPAASAGSAAVRPSLSPGHPITPVPLATRLAGRQVQATVFGFAEANADGLSYFRALDKNSFGVATRLASQGAMNHEDLLIRIDIPNLI